MIEQISTELQERFKESLADRIETECAEFYILKFKKEIPEFDTAKFSLTEMTWEDSRVRQDGSFDRIKFEGVCTFSGILHYLLKNKFESSNLPIKNARVQFEAFSSGSEPFQMKRYNSKFIYLKSA